MPSLGRVNRLRCFVLVRGRDINHNLWGDVMTGLYQVGDIVICKSMTYSCRGAPISKVGEYFYYVDNLPYRESEIKPLHQPWEPELNVTGLGCHVGAGNVAVIANFEILKMIGEFK